MVVTFSVYSVLESETDAVGLVRLRIGNTTVPPEEILLIVRGPSNAVRPAKRGTYSSTSQSPPVAAGTRRADGDRRRAAPDADLALPLEVGAHQRLWVGGAPRHGHLQVCPGH